MKYKYRILLGYALVILLVIGMVTGVIVFMGTISRRMNDVATRKFAVEQQLQEASLIVMGIHADVWDAMLLGERHRQEALRDLDDAAARFYATTRVLADIAPESDPEYRELTRVFKTYYLFGSTILHMHSVAEFQSSPEVVERFKLNKTELNRLLSASSARSRSSFEQSLLSLKQTILFARIVLVVLGGGALLITVLISLYLAGRLTRPVERLAEAAARIAEGDYSEISSTQMSGEFGILVRAFNAMTGRIRWTVSSLTTEIGIRKAAEAELAEARDYLRTILDSTSSLLIAVDQDLTIVHANAAARSHCQGYAVGETRLLRCFSFLEAHHDELKRVIRDTATLVLKSERIAFGEIRIADITVHPLSTAVGNGAVIRVDDVTEFARKDEQIRQMQKMETVSILAGGLAHDINNILAVIMGSVSLIKYYIDSGRIDVTALKELSVTIENSSMQAADLVKNLLTLSRRQDSEFAFCDLREITRKTIAMCQRTFDKSVEIRFAGAEGDAPLFGDATQIGQVLLNICINAWHAMTIMRNPGERQGGTLVVSMEMVEPDAAFLRSHEGAAGRRYWLVRVSDTGVGIEPGIQRLIFDPFFTTKETGKGTGIGLSIAYSIIQAHKGFIDVYSEPGRGTEFRIYLPVPAERSAAEAAAAAEFYCGSGLVLVVDDEAPLRALVKNILTEIGFAAELAEDGRRALELFAPCPDAYVLVLLDMSMPGMSGPEVYAEIKRIRPDIPVIMQSGFRDSHRMEELTDNDRDGFIQKPYGMKELSAKIRAVLDSPQA